jgi:hypothetical protein
MFPLDGSRQRPYDTVEPLAQDLGLTVDTSCDRDDSQCVADVVNGYTGSGNILICWEHDALTDIVDSLGDGDAPTYPDDRYVPVSGLNYLQAVLMHYITASTSSGLIRTHIRILPALLQRTALVWMIEGDASASEGSTLYIALDFRRMLWCQI